MPLRHGQVPAGDIDTFDKSLRQPERTRGLGELADRPGDRATCRRAAEVHRRHRQQHGEADRPPDARTPPRAHRKNLHHISRSDPAAAVRQRAAIIEAWFSLEAERTRLARHPCHTTRPGVDHPDGVAAPSHARRNAAPQLDDLRQCVPRARDDAIAPLTTDRFVRAATSLPPFRTGCAPSHALARAAEFFRPFRPADPQCRTSLAVVAVWPPSAARRSPPSPATSARGSAASLVQKPPAGMTAPATHPSDGRPARTSVLISRWAGPSGQSASPRYSPGASPPDRASA